jgi:hypothetical protein
MLQKIKEFPNKSEDIYVNLITGQEGTLSQIGTSVTPSDRVNKRHSKFTTPKVRSNRKFTRGRNIYYQTVNEIVGTKKRQRKVRDENGKVIGTREIVTNITKSIGKVVKHVQESYSAIQRKTSLLEFYDKVESNKSKWMEKHPEYKRKAS